MFGFLARAIAFVIVISLIRSVVGLIKRLWQGTPQRTPAYRAGAAASNEPNLLQQDPVCGTYVASSTSLKKIVSGHVYHFCSADCRNRFSTT